MRIVHVNTYDLRGGAARAAFRVHQGLLGRGHDSSMFVLKAQCEDPAIKTFIPPADIASRIKRRLRRDRINKEYARYRTTRPPGFEPFQDSRSPHGADIVRQLPECDVVNLHWIADAFVDYPAFFRQVPDRTPVVWTLHDMNAFTGGCHYDLGCGRFTERCGACPQLGSRDADDLSRRIWENKQEAFAHVSSHRIRFVAPSRWLADELQRSSLCRHFAVSVIPYGLSLDEFAPRHKGHAREVLGLPADASVILFLADGLDNRRKGFALLAEALAGLQHTARTLLLSVGRNQVDCGVKVPWVHLGPLSNDRMLSLVYSAADVFVIPSLQDNLPNTVLESMACGTPVVGFATGGIVDMVRPDLTGFLVEPENVPGLRAALLDALGSPEKLAQMAVRCRRMVEEEFSLELQARCYEDLYLRLIKDEQLPSGGSSGAERFHREPARRAADSSQFRHGSPGR